MTKNAGKTNNTQRKRSKDKSKRNFELSGKYSAKAIRVKEEQSQKAKQKRNTADKPAGGK
jgi:hypothetical protein